MLILALESSCDETSAAVVSMSGTARKVLSNIVASQIEVHRKYGGVVPEIAGRAHIEAVSGITHEALDTAGAGLRDIDAVAVTNSPGLIGALLVGMNFAKSLSFAQGIPLVPVDHVRAHAAAAYLEHPGLKPPFTALVVSGGHTCFYNVRDYTDWEYVSGTRDDAAGEAFDKVGRVLGCPYPAGAEMDRLASSGDPDLVQLPSPALRDSRDLSFSGLKTACLNYINGMRQKGAEPDRSGVSASLTKAICGGLTEKARECLDFTGARSLVLAGGVAANSHLRRSMREMCEKAGIGFFVPSVPLCGDNAAMVGAQGYYEFMSGVRAGTDLNAHAD
ncbi:MAG: tRNA (adenosine(37)-N6)-threonylcarbamoyltransferase complex transferase subunit TsaD [Clostridia bacterium]|nr:tRNA (adenosine(37)-N6)-threonylcarbamoyltransferase complex transferase subunit TsaD [Clostridia bacterium]